MLFGHISSPFHAAFCSNSLLITEVENISGDRAFFLQILPKNLNGCVSHYCTVGRNHGINDMSSSLRLISGVNDNYFCLACDLQNTKHKKTLKASMSAA